MKTTETISDVFITEIAQRLREGKRIRRNLPIWGRLHIDRQLPFLCVYRRPTRRQDEGTERLIMGQPAYLIASSHKSLAPGLSALVQTIASTLSEAFGGFLILEIWSGLEEDPQTDIEAALPRPAFSIKATNAGNIANTISSLENELAKITLYQRRSRVDLIDKGRVTPPRLPALLPPSAVDEMGCATIGVVIRPVYRHIATGEILPIVHQAIIRDFNRALQRTFYTFARTQTKYRPPHYQILGRQATVKAVWSIDKDLAEIDSSFDFLLQVTPINGYEAWAKFKQSNFEQRPIFYYRPYAVDPALLKRQLWNIKLERIEDPTIQHLFREKQKELDTQISMLGNINKPSFLYGSMQLYGQLNDDLISTARTLLEKISPSSRESGSGKMITAKEFETHAHAKLERYRAVFPEFAAKVKMENSISGLMVSKGNLLVSDKLKIPESRVDALLSHEVGTHVLTYYNGQAQPFRLLYCGLAGYEELQEGLAVLSEYLVGGLSKPRLRLLAGRVIAAHSLINGATFVETYRLITQTYRFKRYIAFTLVMRVYRAGGLTKDAVYLRGLIQLLGYLQKKPLDDFLFIGKIAIDHIPIIQELQRRQVLQEPKLRPHYLDTPEAEQRLARIGQGLSVVDLIERTAK